MAEERLKIDTVAPQIIVAYDNNDKRNGNYFQEERTAQILYQDKNFEQKNVTFDVGVGKKQQKNVRVQDLEKRVWDPGRVEKTRGQRGRMPIFEVSKRAGIQNQTALQRPRRKCGAKSGLWGF